MRVLFLALALSIFAAAADATLIRSQERLITLVEDVVAAKTPGAVDRILRNAADEPSAPAAETGPSIGVVWFDNWNPRARVWIRGIQADRLFRDILLDEFLLEAADIDGRVDVELEIRAGYPVTITGRLRFQDADFRWKAGDFALKGVNGYMPFRKVIGTEQGFAVTPAQETAHNIRVDEMVWADRLLASNVYATSSYDDKILRFTRMKLGLMGGQGEGSVVMDHRGQSWRMAAITKFADVDLRRLHELLPGLPVFARVTSAVVKGQIGLTFESPDRIRLSGMVESQEPGVIELSPMLHAKVRNLTEDRVVHFQRLTLELVEDKNGRPEAKIDLHRRTAQSFRDLFSGTPFSPVMVTVRIPLLPFVRQLSSN